jgi:hypothetical protein
MSLPFLHGFSPERWAKVPDIMLEKEQGNTRCHRLRILALFESDFNQAKRIIIGRRVSHHLEDNNMISNMQFGSRPGKQCPSAVLSKVLQHDIVQLSKSTAAYIENDAIGCYDRLVNNIVLLMLRKVGLPDSIALCLGNLWDDTLHLIKTIYGTSEITYGSTPTKPLFGPGQGSTCGPLFWILCFILIVDSIDPALSTALYQDVTNQIQVNPTGVAFIDDSSLGVTSKYIWNPDLSDDDNDQANIQHTPQSLTLLVQHWERLLFSTGGAINLQKSHWYLVTWKWEKGRFKMSSRLSTPAELKLTAGYSSSPVIVLDLYGNMLAN